MNMFAKRVIYFSLIIALMVISITGFAHNKVVVVPLMGDDIPILEPKIVFVSAEQSDANFGGVAGADLICQNEAAASGAHPSLGGKVFKAWLYDEATDTYHNDGPTGARTIFIPQGDLVSPSGQQFNPRFTHYLTSGSGSVDLEVACVASDTVSSCNSRYENVYKFETYSGFPPPRSGDVFEGLHLAFPSPSQTVNSGSSSSNCERYENVGEWPRHRHTTFSYNINTIGGGILSHTVNLGPTSCSTPVRVLCLEHAADTTLN